MGSSFLIHCYITPALTSVTRIETNTYRIFDFYYWIIPLKSFWAGEISSVYRLDNILAAMGRFWGQEVKSAMPMALSPTTLVIWFPFAKIASQDIAFAYTLWCSLSFTVFTLAILETARELHSRSPMQAVLFSLYAMVAILSFSFFGCLLHGNTSIMACGLFLFLVLLIAKDPYSPLRSFWIVCICFLLSIKLTYLSIALLLLLIYRKSVEFLFALIAILGTTGVLVIFADPNLLRDWVSVLPFFLGKNVPPVYSSAFHLTTFVTFRSAFNGLIGHSPSLYVCQTVLFLGEAAILTFAVRMNWLASRSTRAPQGFLIPEKLLSVGTFGVFLLFSPYLNGSEDLIILACIAILFFGGFPERHVTLIVLGSVTLLLILLNHNAFPPFKPMWLLWLLKGLLFLVFFWSATAPASLFHLDQVEDTGTLLR